MQLQMDDNEDWASALLLDWISALDKSSVREVSPADMSSGTSTSELFACIELIFPFYERIEIQQKTNTGLLLQVSSSNHGLTKQ